MSNPKKFMMRISSHGAVTFHAGPKVVSALTGLVKYGDAALNGVTMIEVVTAVYEQGLKDGRKEIIGQLDQIKAKANYLSPGRPRGTKRDSN